MTRRLTSYSWRDFSLVLVAMLLSVSCSRTKGPKNLTERTYVATRGAVQALQLANKDRDSNAAVFDPKLTAATKAADEVYNSMGNELADGYAVNQIRSCIEDLKQYRSTLDSRESASQPIEQQLKGLKGTQMKDAIDVVARNGRDLDDCIQEARAFL